MVRVVMGLRGAGKTKQLIALATDASQNGKGQVVVIERGEKLRSEIHARTARLIDTKSYDVCSYQVLRGFITGLYAGNYDISHFFIDSLFKIVKNDDMAECEKFLDWATRFGKENGVEFCTTISADPADATAAVKKYFMQ
ncbi:MAG: hypothetical protein FWE06_08050 [Oscillospiraceae bacterium]|nr:hypothetical protein [Oscillospiraceae bacterium]